MDWIKYRPIYFLVSALVIGVGIFSYFRWGFLVGVDFKGGSAVEYKFENKISTEDAVFKIEESGFDVNSIQEIGENSYLIKLAEINIEDKERLSNSLSPLGNKEELRFESVGPSFGPELVKKTIYAMLVAAISILVWVAYQFRSIKFGASAILAMLHDSLVLFGIFSLLSHFFGAEIDFLFVTAMLTTLSFSVHDTIVVYDRVRELQKKVGGSINEIANAAISQTMVRSLNNSFTIVFMLVALILLGGSTIRWFIAALLVGTISGTYSSPFVAVPLLVTWDEIQRNIKPSDE